MNETRRSEDLQRLSKPVTLDRAAQMLRDGSEMVQEAERIASSARQALLDAEKDLSLARQWVYYVGDVVIAIARGEGVPRWIDPEQ